MDAIFGPTKAVYGPGAPEWMRRQDHHSNIPQRRGGVGDECRRGHRDLARCAAIVLGSKCADPFSRRVLRVSMGAALQLPIIESRDLAADLRELQSAEFALVAAVVGYLTLGERLSRRQIAGGVTIIAGVALLTLTSGS